MSRFALPRAARNVRITRAHKASAALVATASCAAALAFTAAPSDAATPSAHAPAAVKPVSADGMPLTAKDRADDGKKDRVVASSVADGLKVTAVEKQGRTAKAAASRSVERKALTQAPKAAPKAKPKAAPKRYANNLDGWIRQSLDIMHAKGIPGSYEGLHRNIMRESSGNPNAVNDWDINAINGIPSKRPVALPASRGRGHCRFPVSGRAVSSGRAGPGHRRRARRARRRRSEVPPLPWERGDGGRRRAPRPRSPRQGRRSREDR
ncbi:lytic transglycosylase [Streptomyces sp. NRRL S-1448]|uniref:lytic transglycosylase n=1 Tax=Streptomyces sp. NRRL S-1448 TaxID=1463883 RepID=UPI000A4EE7A6|nr:lytic transglycosylase [Streptomyces sp. NRRL S-1448]